MTPVAQIRHDLIEKSIELEILIDNAIANHLCDSEEKAKSMILDVLQEMGFRQKIEVLRKLKLSDQEHISISEKEYSEGIRSIISFSEMRNKLAHNVTYFDSEEKSIKVNLIKRGAPDQLVINEDLLNKINKDYKSSLSFIIGINLEIAYKAGRVKTQKDT